MGLESERSWPQWMQVMRRRSVSESRGMRRQARGSGSGAKRERMKMATEKRSTPMKAVHIIRSKGCIGISDLRFEIADWDITR